MRLLRLKNILFKSKLKTKVLILFISCGVIPYIYLNYSTLRSHQTKGIQTFQIISKDAKESSYANDNEKIRNLHKTLKFILLWTYEDDKVLKNLEEGQSYFLNKKCPIANCFVTKNRGIFNGDTTPYDAVVFGGCNLNHLRDWDLPTIRSPKQKYVYVNREPPQKCLICNPIFDDFFNWTATYRLDSDIFAPFIKITSNNEFVGPNEEVHWVDTRYSLIDYDAQELWEKKKVAALWTSSDLRPAHDYALRLMNALVDCNLVLHEDQRIKLDKCLTSKEKYCSKEIQNNYFFYLAFENYSAIDYVTDTILVAINNYAIPIVYGGADYSRFLPPSSYLNAADYTPEVLAAQMLWIINSNDGYKEYFKFRYTYTYRKVDDDDYLCDLCAALNSEKDYSRTTRYKEMRSWLNPEYITDCVRVIEEKEEEEISNAVTFEVEVDLSAYIQYCMLGNLFIIFAYMLFKYSTYKPKELLIDNDSADYSADDSDEDSEKLDNDDVENVLQKTR